MSNHDIIETRTEENAQSTTTSNTENTANSNTPGATPGDELLLSSLLDADPDLAEEAQAMVDEDESPQVGRPRIDRADLAEKCYCGLFVNDLGQCILRHYYGEW